MKKQPSQSAFINFRALLAFTLCLAGLSLAATAFGAWPDLTAAMRINSQPQNGGEAKINAKHRKWGGASKSMVPGRSTAVSSSSGSATTTSKPAAQTQPGTGGQDTVTKHTNEVGQTVYSISPSRFDISPPLTELATISLPKQTKNNKLCSFQQGERKTKL